MQEYNAQAAVDADTHIVLAALVMNQPVDVDPLQPLTARTIETTGCMSKQFLADAGYYS